MKTKVINIHVVKVNVIKIKVIKIKAINIKVIKIKFFKINSVGSIRENKHGRNQINYYQMDEDPNENHYRCDSVLTKVIQFML